jgi:hypothetical protein
LLKNHQDELYNTCKLFFFEKGDNVADAADAVDFNIDFIVFVGFLVLSFSSIFKTEVISPDDAFGSSNSL